MIKEILPCQHLLKKLFFFNLSPPLIKIYGFNAKNGCYFSPCYFLPGLFWPGPVLLTSRIFAANKNRQGI